MVKRHRDIVERLVAGSVVDDEPTPFKALSAEPFLDRVFSLDARGHQRVRDAMFRLFAELSQLIEEESTADAWSASTRHMHLRIEGSFLSERPSQGGPLYMLNMNADGLMGEWMGRSRHELTKRQFEIARLLADGLTRTAVAEHLGISENTVKATIGVIYKRLGVNNRVDLAKTLM
ncbi:MAG: LuxR C-terminal-related transcriptional regulator [Pirellulales bacterium]|nr:LuxR C-terminal-related transcriptional regulator [Pirellulales bacterium]